MCENKYLNRLFCAFLVVGTASFFSAYTQSSQTRSPQANAEVTPQNHSVTHASKQEDLKKLIGKYCTDCHDEDVQKGELDLTKLNFNFEDKKQYKTWVRVLERIEAGEMPPKKKKPLTEDTKLQFAELIGEPLDHYDKKVFESQGRTVLRRLNRHEYENTLRDLLDAPWLNVKDMLPEDGESHHFNKDGGALQVSHVQMASYLNAANFALHEVVAKQVNKPVQQTRKYYTREQRAFHFFENSSRGSFPVFGHQGTPEFIDKNGTFIKKKDQPFTVGKKDPAKRELEAIAMVRSNYEPGEPKFNQFKAPMDGLYKLKFKTWSIWVHPKNDKQWWRPNRQKISKGRTQEPVAVYSERPPRQMRKIGSYDAYPDPSEKEMTVYLLRGETIRIDAVRFWRVRPPGRYRRNPLATPEGQPGVAFAWMEAQGPIINEWPMKGHKLLFGNLPLKKNGSEYEIKSDKPQKDAQLLLRNFLSKVYRTPYSEKDVSDFMSIFNAALAKGNNFTESLIMSYSAVLCSPKFIYLNENPGELDDTALATRLSYFLHNSRPDTQLMTLAKQSSLQNDVTIKAQIDRLLSDEKSDRFVNAFLDYWLDLRNLNANSPDENLYNDYYLDDFLAESTLDETRAFFKELLQNDMPAKNIIDSDFAMLNGRMATHYSISGVKGAGFRKVELPKDSVRGGFMTQASVLRVTANGTNTSPVMRGVWVNERIIGKVPPPPPPSVPAVEPDTRGATTIRELLAKHRSNASCNSCHEKIDPAGFALESFDIYGGWRDKYRALPEEETKDIPRVPGFGKNGQPFAFFEAQKVDASGQLPSGEKFKDIREFKEILLKDERQIARNLVNQLVTYATGAHPRFGDRPEIERILDRAKASEYGIKTIIKELAVSKLFRNK